jgi:hypothetical protein
MMPWSGLGVAAPGRNSVGNSLSNFFYLWRESGDGGDVFGLQGLIKEIVLSLEKARPEAAFKTCCFEGIIEN